MPIYKNLQNKIKEIELTLGRVLEEKHLEEELQGVSHLNLFRFGLVILNTKLLFLEIGSEILKYFIILFRDPGVSFNLFFKQKELRSCHYSYSEFKRTRAKIRVFSAAGAGTIVATTVITTLILNLLIGPSLPGLAATYTFTQTAWSTLSASTANHASNQSGWVDYTATSTNLSAGAALSIALTASSTVKTTDADFAGASTTQAQVSADSVKLAPTAGAFGSGADGAISTSTAFNISTQNHSGRTCADGGDGVAYSVSSITSSSTLTLSSSPSSGCLAANDVVLLINLQGDGTNVTNVGNYEFLEIQSVSGNQITFTTNKTKYYGNGASDDTNIGTTTVNQRIMLQRVPQYSNVTIQSGGSLTANAWNGQKGGVLAFYASGTMDVQSGGSIDAVGKGFRGGSALSSCTSFDYSYQGESYNKTGVKTALANLGGGGGGNTDCYEVDDGGGGGGYGSSGGGGGGGNPGIAYGDSNLTKIYPGSGGGGGTWNNRSGGSGSGIIYIGANAVNLNGADAIKAGGGNGLGDIAYSAGGGGGSGGSIYILGGTLSLGSNYAIAGGGAGGNAISSGFGGGGAGGVGRIHLKSNSISGTTNPAAATSSLPTTYYSSGAYTSAAINVGTTTSWGSLSWTHSGGQTITLKARSSANSDMSGAIDWASCSNITNGSALSTGNCVTNGHQYIQYQASLSTSDTSVTPSLDDVTIGYNYYPTDQYLISSAYDTGQTVNVMGSVSWDEDASLPAGTTVTVSLRTATSSESISAASWHDFTNATTNCAKTTGIVTCPSSALSGVSANLTDGTDDQWFQYKVTLTSTGANTPTVTEVRVQYVINVAPEVQNVTASQNSDGTVTINYEVRDPDTSTGSITPGYISPTFAYSTNAGSSWTNITSGLADGATSTKAVEEVNWSSYSAIWSPKAALNGVYSTTVQIKVIANDNEGASNIASSTSANFTLDSADPSTGSPAIIVQATGTPAAVILSATDNSALYMKVGLASDLSDAASWSAYSGQATTTLVTDPDTVYVQFKDAYNNTSSILSATTPETPTAMMVQDTTNVLTNPDEYRLFLAWKAVAAPGPGFGSYRIMRSTDNLNFSQLYAETDRAINYYGDSTMSFDTLTYYKVATIDANGNASYYSSTVNAKANGTQDAGEGGGGTPTTPPVITGVTVTSYYTNQATITWNTDKLSNSSVEYITVTGGNFTNAPSQGLATMLDTAANIGQHSVTLNNLTPATTYYFQVKSTDAYGNTGTSKSGTDGYSLTTLSGATISNVVSVPTGNTSAKVTWTTDSNSDSFVTYSANSDLSGSTQVGQADSVTSHTVNLTGLTTGTKYYFYVTSGVAVDTNQGNYYTFTTTSDTAAPVISSVTAATVTDTLAVITWTTNESADSRLEHSTASGAYTNPLTSSASYNLNHSITLSNLAVNTTYYYRVSSSDTSGNSATSSEYSFTTLEALSTESEVAAREAAAETTGRQSISGGGVLIIDKTDRQAPTISQVKVSELKSGSARVSWTTDESANSFVEYGVTSAYGDTYGQYDSVTSHSVNLKNLLSETPYNLRALSADSAGNLSRSANLTFTTPSIISDLLSQEQAVKDIENLAQAKEAKAEILVTAAQKAMELVSQVAGEVSLNILESTLFSQYDAIEKLASVIPAPIFGGEPSVVTTATTATVVWRTNKDANSLVALAPDNVYKISAAQDNPYIRVDGDPNSNTKAHLVKIVDLEPETTYHYQLRSKAKVGPEARSRDFSFTTKTETLEIGNHTIQNVSNEEAIFKWLTNVETDSGLKYTPYRDGKLAIEEAKTASDKAYTVIHELTISDFEGGVVYELEFSGKDAKGNLATKTIPTFSTSADDLPPIIYQVQTDSAISPGKEVKIQTIISWLTNEPTVGRIIYDKGLSGDIEQFGQSTQLETNYTKKHVVVITKFDSGAVYRFRVEALDSAGNLTISKTYTILTPRQKETVFQIILKNFETTFGWVGKVGL